MLIKVKEQYLFLQVSLRTVMYCLVINLIELFVFNNHTEIISMTGGRTEQAGTKITRYMGMYLDSSSTGLQLFFYIC